MTSITSYFPGDTANSVQFDALREAIGAAFQTGNGSLRVGKESGLFISQKYV